MNKIKSFSEYYLLREEEGEEEKALGDIDAMPNEDDMLLKLAKMAISRHQERIIEFFNSLAKHDDDIKNVLGKFRDKRSHYLPHDLRKGSEQEEKDVVAPSTADMSGPL
jgi:hypothetical protein